MVTLAPFDHLRTALRRHDRAVLEPGASLAAAVLVPLYESRGELGLVFTRRTLTVASHKGEISFPGGVIDEIDADVVASALREAQEEVGLEPDHVDVLGVMDDRRTVTGFLITPVVGRIPFPYTFKPSPSEVAEVLTASLAELCRPGVHRVEEWQRGGVSHTVHFYDLGRVTIWGATGQLLHDLLTLL